MLGFICGNVVSVEENTPAVRPQDPARGGYEFTGWYTDKGCSVIYDFDKAVTADVQLYACWKEIDFHIQNFLRKSLQRI